jgi:hypothetical protein
VLTLNKSDGHSNQIDFSPPGCGTQVPLIDYNLLLLVKQDRQRR